ncbi:MAG: 50S ribosomal protein L25 [Pontiellaceae bacterium]|nr:50S ribosomal protein L25 [Pontiellaceae bacterium]
MEDKKLIAKKRDLEGSGNARRLRGAGSLPGVVYGADKDPVSVLVDIHDFGQILHHHTSESLIIDITVEGEGEMSVLVKEVQHHPVTSELMHVDFMRVEADRPIHVDIEIELVGDAAGVKSGGLLDQVMHTIGVECLPADLVEKFEINVARLEIGQALHVSDLKLDAKYKVLVDDEAIVASISGPTAEADEEEEGASEPEVIGEKKAE